MSEQPPWEHGSELTLHARWSLEGARLAQPWDTQASYYGSGRDALRSLLRHGAQELGWKRLLVPYYLCQEVTASAALELPVRGYVDRPTLSDPGERELRPEPGDAVLVVNYYGLRTQRWQFDRPGVSVIEDHTHDPWSSWAYGSSADFAFVSLRKSLPLPDGGVVWSPAGRDLPSQVPAHEERKRASERKLCSLFLKSLYLAGHDVSKEAFRALALDSEEHIATGEPSGMPDATRGLMSVMPTHAWRETRRQNFVHAQRLLSGSELRLLAPEAKDCVPFSLLLLAPSNERREEIRAALPKLGVFPAVLWWLTKPALTDIPRVDHEFSGRVLSIACDYRYDAAHIEELVRRIETT